MKVYIFTIDILTNDSITLFQIYAANKFVAKDSIELLTGYDSKLITYIGDEKTTMPQNWG